MSFLSRRPSRSGSRDSDAGRDDEYGDYDYSPDGYGGEEDESWSPGEYFSPEGIKGRRAGGQRSADREDTRARRGDSRRAEAGRGDPRGDAGRGDPALGYEDRPDDGYTGYAPAGGYGYGADEYAGGAYDLAEVSDEEPAERGGRRRKDRGDWTGIFSLRRDRGEDIWPDDGVSDEDYWASVASDRPLTGPGSPLEADPPATAGSRPVGGPGTDTGARPPGIGGDDVRAAAGPRPGADTRAGGEQRFGDEQRGVTGRLGPPPGLRGDYQPVSTPAAARPATGPQPARPGTGPIPRPGTGPIPRPETGPIPLRSRAGAAGAAGAADAWSSQAGFTQSGGQPSYRPSGPQGSYQPGGPAGRQPDSRESDSRQPDRGADWGERTERIDRVNASGYPEPRGNGYPEPRANSRSQAPGSRISDPFGAVTSGPSRNSGPLGAPVAAGSFGTPVGAGRGGADGARGEGSWSDSGRGTDRRPPERRAPARDTGPGNLRDSGSWPMPARDADRDSLRDSGGWPAPGRGTAPADRARDEDPLTSRAYSRAAVSEADGRSYRVAARRSQAQAKLTEEPTATFTAAASQPPDRYRTGQYDTGATEVYPAARYQTGATAEYPSAQYPAGLNSAARAGRYLASEYSQYQAETQATAARYPGYASQPSQTGQPGAHPSAGQSPPPARRGQSGPASAGRPAAPGGSAGLGRPVGPSSTQSPGGYGRPAGSGGQNGTGGSVWPSGQNRPAGQPGPAAGQTAGNSGRVTLPSGPATHSGQYPAQPPLAGQAAQQPQQPRQPQQPQRTHAQPSRPASPSQLPAGTAGSGTGGASGSPATGAPARTAPVTGQNPYDSSLTGSYPYPSQSYPSRPAAPSTAGPVPGAANPALDGRDRHDAGEGHNARDSRSYRPAPPSADGYGPDNADYGAPGYGAARDSRH